MPTLHLICGLPCAGKTTLAKRLEAETSAVRFCPDEWILDILPEDYTIEQRDLMRDPVESLQWKMAKQLLSIDVDIIIEWGTWVKDERLVLRDEAGAIGACVKFYYLDIPKAELLRRLEIRNKNVPAGSFYILSHDLESWFDLFQAPQPDELASYDAFERIVS